jgi:hypothetical protein
MSVFTVDGTTKVIYETKKLRSTGAHTRVWDMRPNDEFEGAFMLECVTHGTQHARNARLKAEEESHRSHMWCELCSIPEAGKEVRINTWVSREHGTEVAVNAMPDSTKECKRVYAGMFGAPATHDGTWRDPRNVKITFPRNRA